MRFICLNKCQMLHRIHSLTRFEFPWMFDTCSPCLSVCCVCPLQLLPQDSGHGVSDGNLRPPLPLDPQCMSAMRIGLVSLTCLSDVCSVVNNLLKFGIQCSLALVYSSQGFSPICIYSLGRVHLELCAT